MSEITILFGDLIVSVDLPLKQPFAGSGICWCCEVVVEKGVNELNEFLDPPGFKACK